MQKNVYNRQCKLKKGGEMTVKELAEKAGVSRNLIYRRIYQIEKKEGEKRLPTLEELKIKPNGRPTKYC